jgi:16S rRNA (cytosine1402-N4)-methyltransferase
MEELTYHNPVLLNECIEGLNIKPDGVYADVTFGGGGHSAAMLNKIAESGKLYAFDQDEDALKNIPNDLRFRLLPFNFRFLKQSLRLERVKELDGVLADLGVSSHQFDTAERGFSFRFDAELDMRMNQSGDISAKDILNSYSAEKLQNVLGFYGEVRNAKTLANVIVQARQQKKIERISDLLRIIEPYIMGKENRYLSQVFQALRMAVNDEVGSLKDLMQQAASVLKPGGRMSVITFHSIEDRIVKNFFRDGAIEEQDIDPVYGTRKESPFSLFNKKPIEPTAEEVKSNPRSRSARLRVGIKN